MIEFSQYFEDPDGDSLIFQLDQTDNQKIPSLFNFDELEATLNITSRLEEGGKFSLRMTATDPYLGEHSQYFNLKVNTKPYAKIEKRTHYAVIG